jgi:hypothetical protein
MAPKYVDQPKRMASLKARIEKLGKDIENACAEMDESNEMKEDVTQILTKLDRMVKSHIPFQVSLWRLILVMFLGIFQVEILVAIGASRKSAG